MNIVETLVQLRDDLKTWVTNNFCETDGATITNIKNRLSALEAKI